MANRVYIPITDDDSVCSNGYTIRYKESSSPDWITYPGVQQTVVVVTSTSPYTEEDCLIINGLSSSTSYDFEVTRICCDGTQSNITTDTFITT